MKHWKDVDFKRIYPEILTTPTELDTYCPVVSAFDLESTKIIINNEKIAFMYIWQMGIKDEIFYGRTWDELRECLQKIQKDLELSSKRRLIVFDHNLKFDFQYFKSELNVSEKSFIARDIRDVIRCIVNECFEWRDSACYIELSLESVGQNIGIPKLPAFDYDKIRLPGTPLTSYEMQYCENDIKILLEYYNRELKLYNNKIRKIPLTATQRVKRLIWAEYKEEGNTRAARSRKFKDNEKDQLIMKQLRSAYWGAYTWANPLYIGFNVEDAISADLDSAYAGLALTQRFPLTRFKPCGLCDENKILKDNRNAYIITLEISGLRNKYPNLGYLPAHKIKHWEYDKEKSVVLQGKILKTSHIILTITEIDLQIIKDFYTWDKLNILNLLCAKKGNLPSYIINSVAELYKSKKDLKMKRRRMKQKGIIKPEIELAYTKSKTNVSRIYGAFVQDPEPTQYEYDTSNNIINAEGNGNIKKAPEIVYYPWGVWITAYCRREMLNLVKKFAVEGTHGKQKYNDTVLYIDTDCIKVLNSTTNADNIISCYNENVKQKIYNLCEVSDLILSDLEGIGELDIEKYNSIKILGQKRYGIIDNNGQFICRMAGLSSKNKLFDNKTPEECLDLLQLEMDIPAEIACNKKCDYVTFENHREFNVTDYLGHTETISVKSFAVITTTGYSTKTHSSTLMSMADADHIQRMFTRG